MRTSKRITLPDLRPIRSHELAALTDRKISHPRLSKSAAAIISEIAPTLDVDNASLMFGFAYCSCRRAFEHRPEQYFLAWNLLSIVPRIVTRWGRTVPHAWQNRFGSGSWPVARKPLCFGAGAIGCPDPAWRAVSAAWLSRARAVASWRVTELTRWVRAPRFRCAVTGMAAPGCCETYQCMTSANPCPHSPHIFQVAPIIAHVRTAGELSHLALYYLYTPYYMILSLF